jgi:tetratricopeptide (TPR) repeat protein
MMQRTQKWIRATSSLLALWTGLHAVAEASGQETKEAPPLPASGGSGSAAAATPDAQDYHRRALQAFTEARYEQALQLFSLGYADTKHPELLIRIGQTYLKLGRSAEALQACQAYLVRMETPEPTYKGYAEQCIAEAKRSADRGTTAPGPVG